MRHTAKKSKKASPVLPFLFLCVLLVLTLVSIVALKSQKGNTNHTIFAANNPYGFVIDIHSSSKIPTASQVAALNPGWIRLEYDHNYGIPNWAGVKRLILVTGAVSGTAPPSHSASYATWKSYIDNTYVPGIKTLLNKYPGVTALEIWNEEDYCSSGFCPQVPAGSYAYMLKNAASAIKAKNRSIQVVMGGLASGDVSYVTSVRASDSAVFTNVNGIGLHPYGKSPDGWCATSCDGGHKLPFGDLRTAVTDYENASGLPVWVTEIGQGTTDTVWQAEYLQRVFNVLTSMNLPAIIWYSWIDTMTGGDGQNDWGLVDSSATLKPSGSMFQTFTIPASATPTFSVSTTPTVPLSMSPTQSLPTPTPTQAANIVEDTFQRANQTYWGTASSGQTWGADANTSTAFSISNNTGIIKPSSAANLNAILGTAFTNEEVVVSGSLSALGSGSNTLGAVVRWSNTSNFYRAFITGSSLTIQKVVNGAITNLKSVSFTAATNTSYTIRFNATGTTLSAKVWKTGTTEPANWMATTTDGAFSSGYAGIRTYQQGGTTATITSFQATQE